MSEEEKTIMQSNNKFTIDLYSQLSDSKDNIFISPFSIFIVLSMISAGAIGETRSEIENVLHINMERNKYYSVLKNLFTQLRNSCSKEELEIINIIKISNNYNLRKILLRK